MRSVHCSRHRRHRQFQIVTFVGPEAKKFRYRLEWHRQEALLSSFIIWIICLYSSSIVLLSSHIRCWYGSFPKSTLRTWLRTISVERATSSEITFLWSGASIPEKYMPKHLETAMLYGLQGVLVVAVVLLQSIQVSHKLGFILMTANSALRKPRRNVL